MRTTPMLASAIAALLLTAATLAAQPTAPSFVIRHARVFDGERMLGERDVLVRDGRIAAVAKNLAAPAGTAEVDGTGRTLLPGLIDAHTHVFGDALEQALAFGVTTELDMFTGHAEAATLRAEQRAGHANGRADLYSAGTLVTAPGGHGTEYGMKIPTITTPDSAQAFVDARIAEGSDYIKIVVDNGSTYGMTTPTLSEATVRALVKAAHARGRLAVLHVGSLADARLAIGAGADGLMHLFVDRDPDPAFGRYVAAHHAFVVPTLGVLRSISAMANGPALVGDARLARYISAAGRASALSGFPMKVPTRYAAAELSIRQLKAAHVPILAGTDAPNPGTAHGASLHQEMEWLVAAGLTPTEALVAATSAPARAFRLADRGRIVVGRRADLVLVAGDPTADITATRAIERIWKGGVAFDRAALAAAVASAAAHRQRDTTGRPPLGTVSSFDDGTAHTAYGAGWMITTDRLAGGTSSAQMKVVDGGASGTPKALELTGEIKGGVPFSWGGAMFMPNATPMRPVNLSAAKEIRFWARGDGRSYTVMVFAESSGRMPLMQTFLAGPEWKEFTFPLSSFGATDGHDIMGIAITGGPALGTFALRIDELKIQ